MRNFKIRVRNKYLVLLSIALVMFVGLVLAAGGDYLFEVAEKARQANDPVKALAYYDKFIAEYPSHPEVPAALYWSAELFPDESNFEAIFFPHYSSYARRSGVVDEIPEGTMTREERYWRIYREFPDHWAANHVKFKLAEIQLAKGNVKEAEELYLGALYDSRATCRIESAFALIDIYLDAGRVEEAWEILEFSRRELPYHLAVQQQFKMGDILKAKGDYQAAREAYEKVIAVYEEERKRWDEVRQRDEKDQAVDYTLMQYQEDIARKVRALEREQLVDSNARITGEVTLKGAGLPGIEVLLWKKSGDAVVSPREDEIEKTVTGEDGRFQFRALPGFAYQVGIRLNHETAKRVEGTHLQMIGAELIPKADQENQVQFRFVPSIQTESPDVYDGGPLELRWQPFAGAFAYSVSLSSVMLSEGGMSITGGEPVIVTGTEYTFERIPEPVFGSFTADEKGVHPVNFIGIAKASDALQVEVKALDEKGRVLSSSGGLYFGPGTNPSITIEIGDIPLTEEERLLKERRYDEAVRMLESRLESSPDDEYALDLLSRIYFSGTHREGEDWSGKMFHQNRQKSMELLEKLAELRPGADVFKRLMVVYKNLSEEKKRIELCRRLDAMGEADWVALNSLAYHELTSKDNYQKALEYYQRARGSTSEYHGFTGPLALYLLTGQADEAAALLEEVQVRPVDRLACLREAIRSYAASEWVTVGQEDYMPEVSSSFREAVEIWEAKGGPHPEFLLMIARLSDNEYYRHRQELKQQVAEFRQKHQSRAPILSRVVDALASYLYIE